MRVLEGSKIVWFLEQVCCDWKDVVMVFKICLRYLLTKTCKRFSVSISKFHEHRIIWSSHGCCVVILILMYAIDSLSLETATQIAKFTNLFDILVFHLERCIVFSHETRCFRFCHAYFHSNSSLLMFYSSSSLGSVHWLFKISLRHLLTKTSPFQSFTGIE